MSRIVDIHAHVQFSAFKDDADEVIARAREFGVKMVAPSSEIRTAKRAIVYAEKYPKDIWASVGLHPIHLKAASFSGGGDDMPGFETYGARYDETAWRPLAEHPRTVALGEVGLDYAGRLALSEEDRRFQEETYRRQIEVAISLKKPIIQHCRSGPVDGVVRDAHDDALTILREYVQKGLHGVAHCYSGNAAQAAQYRALGFSLSFTGLITYNDSWDDVIREMPLDSIMTETDIPYMTPRPRMGIASLPALPMPKKGQRNEPMFVWYVAARIAEIKGVPLEDVARQTSENAQKIFGIAM